MAKQSKTPTVEPEVILPGKSKYKPEYCEKLIEHMTEGFSFDSFAGLVKVGRSTLFNWAKDHRDFAEAKDIGFEASRLFWEDVGKQGLWGSKESTFNSTVWIFSMKNRFGWTDKQHLQIGVDEDIDETTALLKAVPRDKLLALVKKKEPA